MIVSTFGCELPDRLRACLALGPKRPSWIHLEYLSAETWVDGCHGLAAIKSADRSREFFFYPGFRAATGGLLREQNLLTARDAFLAGRSASNWWRARGLPESVALRVSIFCYSDAPLRALLEAMAQAPEPSLALVPVGVCGEQVAQFLASRSPASALPIQNPSNGLALWRAGRLTLARLPMLPIDEYDHLLWQCDLNFVRGEDSWVRALWAGKPMIWQPYRQTDDTHQIKLAAFLDWQKTRLPGITSSAWKRLAGMSHAWSTGTDPAPEWQAFRDQLPTLAAPFERLAHAHSAEPGLAEKLVEFCRSKL